MGKQINRICLLLFFVLGGMSLSAQSLDQAKKLYNEGKYDEAKPVFEKLVNQSPNNASYNQWYGVCCYETGDIEGSLKYLEFAMKRRVQDSYRYLGEVYAALYEFDKSVDMWEQYIAALQKKKEDTEPYDQKLRQAKNLLRMMDKIEDVQVIDSVVIDKTDFLSAYQLSEECGALEPYSDFFEGGGRIFSTVYTNQKGDKIYFGRPDENDVYTLYTQSKLMDAWGDERKVVVDQANKEDNNFPFVMSDGVTIYYASKGSGSIGGYDLFITRYNTNNDSYLAPEQLGMPFNSLSNDYMLVIDEVKGLGWFVSDRNQPEGKVCAYLYIPDESRKRIAIEDPELKKQRAALTSIALTWKEGADYSEQIRLAHEEIPYGKKEKEMDFTFVINNSLTYYTWDEIKNPEARNLYEKAVSLEKQIDELEGKVTELRERYTKGSAAVRDQLRETILQAEEQLNSLYPQLKDWEKKARNAEVTYLSKAK